MTTHSLTAMEPSAAILAATRHYLEPIRAALGAEFRAAYVTGSALTQGFDPRRSRVNLLLVARSLDDAMLDRLREAIPATRKAPHFDPLFLTERQIQKSLDAFPVEWLDIQERHLRIEGEDVLGGMEVPRTHLRLQCEHELRSKHIRLRQSYLLSARDSAELARTLRETASGFATLFRTLLRLGGESPPAETGQVVALIAERFGLDAQHLLGQHLVRYSGRRYKADEIRLVYRRFLAQVDRLVVAIDQLKVQ